MTHCKEGGYRQRFIGTMEQEKQGSILCSVWIDEQNHIVTFRNEAGFREIPFVSQKEKFAFAIEKCSSGYRIQ